MKYKNNTLVNLLLLTQNTLHKSQKKNKRLWYKVLNCIYIILVQLIYSGYLPATVKLGENIFFPHGLNSIFISGAAEIGEGTVIYQQVTIGSTFFDNGESKAPVIGSNCILGAGCKIIGSLHVGDNVKIATNVSINKNVPSNCTVVPCKSRYIEEELEVL